ncbi:AMP-binding protein [Mycobacterium sp.]|uniref:AMP-binding protein n=1 Tax=Mycobacterium sp. TaxID=1785 RepID=UPI003BABB4AA
MTDPQEVCVDRVPLSRSQQNIYNGVLQDSNPALYLIGKSYRFRQLELSTFLVALESTIGNNPVHLCVLQAPLSEEMYPDLVPRLQASDIVWVRPASQRQNGSGADALTRIWASGILAKPLARYTVWTDESGQVSGLDAHTHHILLDGGATGIIEADLARRLAAEDAVEIQNLTQGLIELTAAHRCEQEQVEKSLRRFRDAVHRELTDATLDGGRGQRSHDARGTAAKGILYESASISGAAYDAVAGLAEEEGVPLNALVTAAAVAVDASLRQSSESLLVHPVDNRFGDPDLNVATCLVNSVAHAVRLIPFASVQDVVRTLDRDYVKATRRRWFREEHYRRMYLAINRTSHVEALTLNFIREPCASGLRSFLSEPPVATDIGPVEGMTVACVLDEHRHTLNLAIWDRADLPASKTRPGVAERIVSALESMVAAWHQPIAMIVDEWFGIAQDGAVRRGDWALPAESPHAPAWFLDPISDTRRNMEERRYVYQWVAWLVCDGAVPGDVIVFTDDNTDKTVDLLIACHLSGCGYSVCDSADDVPARAHAIADHDDGVSARIVDVDAARLAPMLGDELQALVDDRIYEVTHDNLLAAKTAYIMPTSGSTGQPKLVRVTHGSLALFCLAVRHAYGWGLEDTVLQCAPLTSDISVEEIFGGAFCGSKLVRSTAMRSGDLHSLAGDLVAKNATVVDLPTAVWHLLCDDHHAMGTIGSSSLRQIVVGGEPIRPGVVDKWIEHPATQGISLVSSYGPTEATVVATYLPLVCDGTTIAGPDRLRLGRPIVTNTVFIAFGEIVIVGDLVSSYLGIDSCNFGSVTAAGGSRRRAFATADRVTYDEEGFPVFAGRKDAIVKVSGKRVDIAEVARRLSEIAAVSDVAVELHEVGPATGLGVWFESERTRESAEDAAVAVRIRRVLTSLGVPSFSVVGVPRIPRKPSGKVDSDNLRSMPQFVDAVHKDTGSDARAAGLAEVWSRHLGRAIRADSSLLGEGIGSLDLIRILPDSRRYLGRHISVLDLISADTAANLASSLSTDALQSDAWMDVETATEVEHDLGSLWRQPCAAARNRNSTANMSAHQPIVVLGASGIVGTGFARAVLDLRQSGVCCPEVVFVVRSQLPETYPWLALQSCDAVRIEYVSADFGPDLLADLIRGTGARTVINCIGNTNVLVPYRQLRLANVEFVSTMAQACATHGARLVHLSTYVVNADVAIAHVTDPRAAPYPYAASKALAELAVSDSSRGLDFTLVRLPRVLGTADQMRNSADVLASVVAACTALRAYPAGTLTEEVTTSQAAAKAIMGMVPELAGSAELGCGITVLRGEAVAYAELLSDFARDEIDILEWKQLLDQSDWAKRNPRRWSVVDAWVTLGMRLGARTYAEYLADFPTIALEVESVAELVAEPQSLRALLASEDLS